MERWGLVLGWLVLVACAVDVTGPSVTVESDIGDVGRDIGPSGDTDGFVLADVAPCELGAEVCNGVDDDCDGEVDESPAESSCARPHMAASCGVRGCEVECLLGYHDCNGELADGCERTTTELLRSTTDCGACGQACTNPWGETQCAGGSCYPTCLAGGEDADGDPNNGCERVRLSGAQCGTLTFPQGVTVELGDVSVCAFESGEVGGRLRIEADVIVVSGRIDAAGRGYGGGGAGGGGSGGSTGNRRAAGGAPGAARAGGVPGVTGEGVAASCGGAGGAGGRGGGPAAGGGGGGGAGGIGSGGSCAQDGNEGANGTAGQHGGYAAAATNGDASTDLTVWPGSGGGGGGGAGGNQPQSWGSCDCGGVGGSSGGSGGGGGAGNAGGGAVELVARLNVRVDGAVHTRGHGAASGDGQRGHDGRYYGCEGVLGETGGAGGAATATGQSGGGGGGSNAQVCGHTRDRTAGTGGAGGAGAGGGILLMAPHVEVAGRLDARGGAAGNGGTVKIFAESRSVTGAIEGGRTYIAGE